MALPLYALTLFVSAFILFLVQPIVGKIILPKLGGTPQVWNTCMVFFQMVLLAGYAYTHNASTRLNLRQQLIAHAVLLLLPLIVLLPFPFALGGELKDRDAGSITGATNTGPIEITAANHKLETGMRVTITGVQGNTAANDTWMITKTGPNTFVLDGSRGNGAYSSGGSYEGGMPNPNSLWGFVPELGANPIPSTLAILFTFVALPFLVVSTTAPLLQKWFVHTGHPAAKDPYFLYGASNLGSMLSLIVYPAFLEPYLSLREQGWTYAIGYISLIAFVMVCAGMVWNSKEVHAAPPKPASAPPPPATPTEAQTGITATPPTPGPGAPAPAPAATAVKAGLPDKKASKGFSKPHAPAESIALIRSDEMTPGRRIRWILLAAIPSSLMLGITTHITTDLSPMPLFWLVPLILYLLSFILVFARWPVVWTEKPHEYFLYAQPFFVAFMIMVDVLHLTSSPAFIGIAIFAHVAGFFTTTMMCHGELAKDRPGTKHLTEFYLMMSVGGMVGGIFNGLVAPVVFPQYWEFPLAIFAAAIVRPKMFDVGLLDNFVAGLLESNPEPAQPQKGHKGKPHTPHAPAQVTANEGLVRNLDFAWPILLLVLAGVLNLVLRPTLQNNLISYGLPLVLACLCFARPLRFGLAVGGILLLHAIFVAQSEGDSTMVRSRSYFGAISVKQAVTTIKGYSGNFEFRQLIHGHINHGMNFQPPKTGRGDPEKDLSRYATTYYHREGPVGRVMEKYNWFPGPKNTFHGDARLPTALIASVAADLGSGTLPMTMLTTAWSEPPFATVGLGTGTMASYGRPYQHVHFYEIDNQIQRLSLHVPSREILSWDQYNKDVIKNARREVYFNYLEQAVQRGCSVQVLMGDARLRMALPYTNHYTDPNDKGGGPDNFYHMMVVDAFSSDAIPAHLLTKQAFRMYFDKLTEEGILCVHTSNRFVDLPKVVSAVAADLGFKHLRGHDNISDDEEKGHFTSEWVMVARKQQYLERLSGDTTFLTEYKNKMRSKNQSEKYWEPVGIESRYVWTDDHYNLLSVVRWGR